MDVDQGSVRSDQSTSARSSISDCDESYYAGECPGGCSSNGLELGDRPPHDPPVVSAPALPAREQDPLPVWAPKYIEVPRPGRCPMVWHFPARVGSVHTVPECWFCPSWNDRRSTPWPIGVPGAPRYAAGPRYNYRCPRRLDPDFVALIWRDPSRSYPFGRPCVWINRHP